MAKPKPKTKTTYIDDRQPRLKELQDLVGGLIQVVYADGGKTQIVMDEEGKIKGKPINLEAADKLTVTASAASDLECFISVLEIT